MKLRSGYTTFLYIFVRTQTHKQALSHIVTNVSFVKLAWSQSYCNMTIIIQNSMYLYSRSNCVVCDSDRRDTWWMVGYRVGACMWRRWHWCWWTSTVTGNNAVYDVPEIYDSLLIPIPLKRYRTKCTILCLLLDENWAAVSECLYKYDAGVLEPHTYMHRLHWMRIYILTCI